MKKKNYKKPQIKTQAVFEKSSLACNKTTPANPACRPASGNKT